MSKSTIKKLIENEVITDIGVKKAQLVSVPNHSCDACIFGKQTRHPFSSEASNTSAADVLHTLHVDVMGPIDLGIENVVLDTLGNPRFVSVITDEKSRRNFVKCIQKKAEATDHIINFITTNENQLNKTVKIINSDNGLEYCNNRLKEFMEKKGIMHTVTYAFTPEHNGISERTNRSIMEMARTLLFASNLSAVFWSAAVSCAAYLLNFKISKGDSIGKKSSIEIWSGEKPTIRSLHIFGSDTFAHINEAKRSNSKLGSHSTKGIFIGYSVNRRYGVGYKIYDIEQHRVICTRDAIIKDGIFSVGRDRRDILPKLNLPFAHIPFENTTPDDNSKKLTTDDDNKSRNEKKLKNSNSVMNNAYDDNDDDNDDGVIADRVNNTSQDICVSNYYDSLARPHRISTSNPVSSSNLRSELKSTDAIVPLFSSPIATRTRSRARTSQTLNSSSTNLADATIPTTGESAATRRYPLRSTAGVGAYLNTSLEDYYHEDVADINSYADGEMPVLMKKEKEISVKNGLLNMLGYAGLLEGNSEVFEPTSYQEAISCADSEKWQIAMQEELAALKLNNTWSVVKLPKGANVVSSKWVFKVKLNEEGKISKYKCRLVARGFLQKEGIDYDASQTYAPVIRFKSLKILLSLANSLNLIVEQADVITAFLHAPINETLYLAQPEGFHIGGKEMVLKLNKCLYGTRQASYMWHETLNEFIVKELQFRQLVTDQCVYVKLSKSNKLILLTIFVDDLLFFYDTKDQLEWSDYRNKIELKFRIKKLGNVSWLLGMSITREELGENRILKISHRQYLISTLKKLGMMECKSELSPASTSVKLTKDQCPASTDESAIEKQKEYHSFYLSAVGALSYASVTSRPDLNFATLELSKYCSNPGVTHMTALKRTLRYVKHSINTETALTYTSNKNDYLNVPHDRLVFNLYAFSDASWAEAEDRRSTSGFIIKLNQDTIAWSSKRQNVVALSSCESEYLSLSYCCQEILYIRHLLSELNIRINCTLFCDNLSTIQIATKDNQHGKTKHIQLRHHFIRQLVKEKIIKLEWISTVDQLGDIMTKNLNKKQFIYLRDRIMNKQEETAMGN